MKYLVITFSFSLKENVFRLDKSNSPEWQNGAVEVAELQDLVGRVERAADVLEKDRKSVRRRLLW